MFVLLVPNELPQELTRKVSTKRYLARRIPQTVLEELLALLVHTGHLFAPSLGKMSAISRDPKDDYLLAYVLSAEADYIVTGDNDLLVLEAIAGIKIVTPTIFLSILDSQPSP